MVVDYTSKQFHENQPPFQCVVHGKPVPSDKVNFLDGISGCGLREAAHAVLSRTSPAEKEPSVQFPRWTNSYARTHQRPGQGSVPAAWFQADKQGSSSALWSLWVFYVTGSGFVHQSLLIAEQWASGSHLSVSIKSACHQDCRPIVQKRALGRGFECMPYGREQENIFKGRYLLNPTYN